jgi:dipeptidyl aminopeptidase/acylaminoacyl peptidase
VLFGNPAKSNLQLAPDGKRLAYIGPSKEGVANVWVQTLGVDDARMVTHDNHQGIYQCGWAPDGRQLLYQQDRNGDENLHLYSTNLETGVVRDLTPFVGARVQNVITDAHHPDIIMVGLNLRNRAVFDMYRIDLKTGAVELEAQNPGDVMAWTVDEDFVIRGANAFGGDDAHTTIRVRDDGHAPWRDLRVIPFEQCPFWGQVNGGSLIHGFTPDGKGIYLVESLKADKTRLVKLDAVSGEELDEIASDPRSDVEYTLGSVYRPLVERDPQSHRIQAVGFYYTRLEWKILDPSIQEDFAAVARIRPDGEARIVNRVDQDRTWLVQVSAHGSNAYYLYHRAGRRAELLVDENPELTRFELTSCQPVIIKSHDGLDLVSYLSVPPGKNQKHLPLILFPHGGPWWRDRWSDDPHLQWLANRGYAVLQVNFRGSTGLGKRFLNLGNRQFGDQAVMGDLLDAVRWAVDSGVADPQRIGIMGGSFGGYATLAGIAFHPEVFRCAVDIVGPSNMATSLKVMPSYWAPVKRRWVLRLGDAEHDEEWNRKISPLFHVDNIRAPLLIGHGLNDPRVNINESEQIVQAMRSKKLPVTFIVYPDEGHGFNRPENNLDFFGRVEEFLAANLGGRKEPWLKVPGSTAQVR